MSTTALHWLDAAQLRAMYAELATVLRPGGLMLDGDHLKEDEAAVPGPGPPRGRRQRARGPPSARPAGSTRRTGRPGGRRRPPTPELAGPAAERQRRRLSEDHHGSESVLLIEHVAALRAAGFAEIGTLWQYGENRILCAVTPA